MNSASNLRRLSSSPACSSTAHMAGTFGPFLICSSMWCRGTAASRPYDPVPNFQHACMYDRHSTGKTSIEWQG
ncbi:hypothetical protein EJ02DRAFT_451698 [Clathrospora elynae]|uniref:Uncharacterized protein n=1 Tax=Clathrospora elynae TaxID=706981 RepID=A0A6A5T826_9PLEO|nr:hypothetical protein EJ02DRAFT_451698 [Clathrospora elynae]